MNRKEWKSLAKAQIKGKIGILFVITLIIGGISAVASGLLSFIPVAGPYVYSFIIAPAFSLSLVRVYLLVIRGGTPEVKDAFSGFDDFWSAFKVTFLVGLYTFLWSLLFIIPGIVKSYSYSMSLYILAENPGKSARECINESKIMTNGHKWELFVLVLSFMGWLILTVLTLGIAGIWAIPYMNSTYANAYVSMKPAVAMPDETAPVAEAAELEEPAEH